MWCAQITNLYRWVSGCVQWEARLVCVALSPLPSVLNLHFIAGLQNVHRVLLKARDLWMCLNSGESSFFFAIPLNPLGFISVYYRFVYMEPSLCALVAFFFLKLC